MDNLSINPKQDVLEKIIWRFLSENRELVLRKLIGGPGLVLTAEKDQNINIEVLGAAQLNVTVGKNGKVVFKRSE